MVCFGRRESLRLNGTGKQSDNHSYHTPGCGRRGRALAASMLTVCAHWQSPSGCKWLTSATASASVHGPGRRNEQTFA